MSSSYSIRFRLNYQAPGDNLNTWGVLLNSGVFQLLEDTIAGRLALTVNGLVTLGTANGATDQARMAWIDATGVGGTVTIPAVEKLYDVLNGCTGTLVFTCGGATVATIPKGGRARIACDGSAVKLASASEFGGLTLTGVGDPLLMTDAVNLRTLVNTAFQANAGIFPGQANNAGMSLKTDGSHQYWGDPLAPNPVRRKALLTNGTALTGLYWSFVGLNGYASVSGAYTPTLADAERVLRFAAGGSLPLGSASGYDAGFSFYAKVALGAPAVAVQPAGQDTVDGTTGYPLQPNEMRLFQTDGVSAWTSTIVHGYCVTLVSSATFQVGPGYGRHVGLLWGGGGGGSKQAGGVAGAGGGGCVPFDIAAAAFGLSQPIVIGAGGAGATQTYSLGSTGGTSSIGTLVSAYGGLSNLSNSGGGGGALGSGPDTGGGGFSGGMPVSSINAVRTTSYGGAPGGAYDNTNNIMIPGGSSVFGGGGGGAYSVGPGGGFAPPGSSIFGGSGGAASINGDGGAGAAPGGGGGGTTSNTANVGNGGQGGRGQLDMRGIA